jgi:hypothetical protein
VSRAALVAAVVLAVIAGAVLGYGYRHHATHGYLSVSVVDAQAVPIAGADVTLRDARGAVLGRWLARPPVGAMWLAEPAVYDCHQLESPATVSAEGRAAWDACFERYSRWVVTRAQAVAFADVHAGDCVLSRLPVTVTAFGDTWWLWWVPLPHIGGPPMQYFTVGVRLDRARCMADGGRR